MTSTLSVDWARAQAALRLEVARTTALLRAVRNTDAPALGVWNAAEVAMHLSQAWILVPGLARDDLSAVYELVPALAGTAGSSIMGDIWDLGGVTMGAVRSDPERDTRVIADRIEERADAFLAECAGRSAGDLHPWMVEGTTVTLATLICHLLSETVVHGGDIARAEGRPWPVDRAHAALILQGFFAPAMAALGPTALVDPDGAAGVRATFDIRLRGGGGFHLLFDDGKARVEAPSARPVDCHISADPAALLQVMWGRRSQWRAIATGQLVAWGRRPWLGPRLRMMMRNP